MALFSERQHGAEPWAVEVLSYGTCIKSRRGLVADMAAGAQGAREADAARIVACVNALAGLDPAAVAGVVEALERIVGSEPRPRRDGHYDADIVQGFQRTARSALSALRGGK